MEEDKGQFTVDKVEDANSIRGLSETNKNATFNRMPAVDQLIPNGPTAQEQIQKNPSTKWIILIIIAIIMFFVLRAGWFYWFMYKPKSLLIEECGKVALEKAEARQALSQQRPVTALLPQDIIDKESYNNDFLQCLKEQNNK